MFFEGDKTVYSVDDINGKRNIVFDNTYTNWMRHLYVLITHIAQERENRGITIGKMRDNPRYRFLGLAESVSDQLMYELIKDELSECSNNCNLDKLAYHVLPQMEYEPVAGCHIIDEMAYAQIKGYFQRLVCDDFNKFTTAQFYDFYVSYWSCFESCITLICELYSNNINEAINDAHFKKARKFIGKSLGEEQAALFEKKKTDFLKQFPKYKSFSDNYNYLYGIIKGEYRRNIKDDKNTLLYCGAFRNTLHNNGVHNKQDMELVINDVKFELIQERPAFFDDNSKIFMLANEIFDVYVALIDALDALAP